MEWIVFVVGLSMGAMCGAVLVLALMMRHWDRVRESLRAYEGTPPSPWFERLFPQPPPAVPLNVSPIVMLVDIQHIAQRLQQTDDSYEARELATKLRSLVDQLIVATR